MSVKVPITKADVVGQKSTRARADQKRRAEFKKQQATIPLPNSDLQFIKNIHDEGRFVLVQGARTTDGTVCSIIPANGTTFYLLGASTSMEVITGTGKANLERNGELREKHIAIGNNTNTSFNFGLRFDSMIGNGTKAYTIEFTEGAGNVKINATLYGYFANTPTVVGM